VSAHRGLRVRDLTVQYGGLVANRNVSLDVEPGTVVGLIGPNGAGKSTFVDAVSGFVESRGTVELDGRRLNGLAPHRRKRLGLARTWQSVELFTDLTVRANVAVADRALTVASFLRDAINPGRSVDHRRVDGALESVGLADVADAFPGELSLGQRKRLGVARGLAGSPQVVLLDEPAAGLDPSEREQFGRQLRSLAADGLGVLLIEHDVDLVLRACDWVVVLHFGVVLAAGTPATIRRDERVAAAYLGHRNDELAEPAAP
jgi:branched-chain amino acid transport system ATP-binding protein